MNVQSARAAMSAFGWPSVMAIVAATLAAVALAGWQYARPPKPAQEEVHAKARIRLPFAPLTAEATDLRPVSPQDALAINAAIPVAGGPNPAARPFLVAKSGPDYSRALYCLASAVYYEAGGESSEGQQAVAQVVLNRVRHPAFPATICGVAFEGSARVTGCQFTFTCNGAMTRGPSAFGWARAERVAAAALSGKVYKPVGLSTHYHANWVVPYWAPRLVKTAVVGAHIFYRWPRGWSVPSFFARGYAGGEPDPAIMVGAVLQMAETPPAPPVEGDAAAVATPEPAPKPSPLAADRARSDLLIDRQSPALPGGRPKAAGSVGTAQTGPADFTRGCAKAAAAAPLSVAVKAQGAVAAKVGDAC